MFGLPPRRGGKECYGISVDEVVVLQPWDGMQMEDRMTIPTGGQTMVCRRKEGMLVGKDKSETKPEPFLGCSCNISAVHDTAPHQILNQ